MTLIKLDACGVCMQILVAFPIGYSLYAVTASGTLTIIQFLAPFVILGIGLDDVFVFVGIYRSLLVYSRSYDVATRLQVCCPPPLLLFWFLLGVCHVGELQWFWSM